MGGARPPIYNPVVPRRRLTTCSGGVEAHNLLGWGFVAAMIRLALGVGAILGLSILVKRRQGAQSSQSAELVPGSALFVDVRQPVQRRTRPGRKCEIL